MKHQTTRPRTRIIFFDPRQVLRIPPIHSFGSFVPDTLYPRFQCISDLWLLQASDVLILMKANHFPGAGCSSGTKVGTVPFGVDIFVK